jgi:hypothetical protein
MEGTPEKGERLHSELLNWLGLRYSQRQRL